MEKESYIIKLWKHWNAMWQKITWKEIIFLFILGKIFLLYIAIYQAHYYVECDDGRVEEILITSTKLCDRDVFVERKINFFGVDWKINYLDENGNLDYSYNNNFSNIWNNGSFNLSIQR